MSKNKSIFFSVPAYVLYAVFYLGLTVLLGSFFGPIVYRLSNFGITCLLAVYLFKNMLLPDIQNKVVAKEQELKDLKKESGSLLKMRKNLEQELQEQEALSKTLYDQIKRWSFSFDKKCEAKKEQQEQLVEAAKKRSREQAAVQEKHVEKTVVMHKALQATEDELVSLFSSEEEGKRFNDAIIACIKQEDDHARSDASS